MRIKVLRQVHPGSEPYWEMFQAEVPGEMSVAGLLDYLNYHDDITDETGKKTTRIGWACSCLQGMCGACAMVINGVPALACETFLKDLKKDTVTIRPLQKFPVIHDLLVDRAVIYENLKKTNMYIGTYRPAPEKNRRKSEREHRHQYEAAKCLKCGLCLEVCPNYTGGEHFYGALFANDCYLVSERNTEKSAEIRRCYGEHFAGGCSKALSCAAVCPMGIPVVAAMAHMNRGAARARNGHRKNENDPNS